MKLNLTEVSGDETRLTGYDENGQPVDISGSMAFPRFQNAHIAKGPVDLMGTPCEAVIDDLTAVVTLRPKIFRFSANTVFFRR